MFIPLSRPTKIIYRAILLSSWLLAVPQTSLSLATDQKRDIEIVANASEIDDRKNITIFTGQVIVTQGSIRITGDKMTVTYNEHDDIDTLIMEGKPATYRQLPDTSNVADEAEALRMEYRKVKNLIILTDRARVKQASGSMSGERIEYDTALSRIRATSTPNGKEVEAKPGERVKILIPAKSK